MLTILRLAAGTAPSGSRSPSRRPPGFTVAEHAAKVRQLVGHDGYTTRQAAYDLRSSAASNPPTNPGRTRRYDVPLHARTISALLALRDYVIAPILAGIRSPRMGRKPEIWTAADRDYEALRIGMQTLSRHIGMRVGRGLTVG